MSRWMIGVLSPAAVAFGQVVPVPAFTGDRSEGFTDEVNWNVCTFCEVMEFFESSPGGTDPICTARAPQGGSHLHATASWGYYCTMFPAGTANLFASTGGGGVRFEFTPGFFARRFGGFFGTNSNVGGATAFFYDSAGTLIGSEAMPFAADCKWNWFGWSFTPSAAAIEIVGSFTDGSYVMMDNLEWSQGSACYADCEDDGDLDIFDYLCFQGLFAELNPYADCERDGDWDTFDFLCFQGEYANGCD